MEERSISLRDLDPHANLGTAVFHVPLCSYLFLRECPETKRPRTHTQTTTHTHTQFATPWRNMPCPVLNLPGIGLKEFQVEKH
jgi:hypothetical protein